MILLVKNLVISLILIYPLNFQSGDSLLKEVQEKYKSINNFTASFAQEGGANKLSGKLYYSKGNKLRVELKNRTVVSDAETIWNYLIEANRVVINSVENNPTSLSIDTYLFEYPSKSTVSYETEGDMDIIQLKPINGDLNFKMTRFWVNKDKLIEKIEIIDLTDNKYSFGFTSIKINQNLSDTLFSFDIPEEAEVIDLR